MIRLTLPVPVTANLYWRTYMPKGFKAPVTVLSAEAKAFKREVAILARQAGIRAPITGRVRVAYTYYPKRPLDAAKRAAKSPTGWDNDVRALDIDNINKGLFDALKGVVFEDDKWVFELCAVRAEPDGDARIEVAVERIVAASPQSLLIDITADSVTGAKVVAGRSDYFDEVTQ